MPRNFLRRVEVMFPIDAPDLKERILDEIIPTYLNDNASARYLRSDGVYERIRPEEGQAAFRCQDALSSRAADAEQTPKLPGKKKVRTAPK